VKKMMRKNMRGELTDLSQNKQRFSLQNAKMVNAIGDILKAET
jgi:hypothetical protein